MTLSSMKPHTTMSASRWASAFTTGLLIGTLGGLIGLGGAEFRLPLLIGLFGFAALPAVILNKAMSLVVVTAALVFRTRVVSGEVVLSHWPVITNLLAGSLLGAWYGAGWATRLQHHTLYRVIAGLLVLIAVALVFGHGLEGQATPALTGWPQMVAGVGAGACIGVVASLLGVAGGELLIPTLVLLFGADIKLAGSLSLAVSLPTMLVGFTRYSRDGSFAVLKDQQAFVLTMAASSLAGAWLGGLLLGQVPNAVLMPLLAAILLVSALKMWRHP